MIRSTATSGLLVVLLGCTGSIQDGPGGKPSSPKPGQTPAGAGGTGDPGAVNACRGELPPGPARLRRLTHQQLRNTVFETFGVRVPVLDTLPEESRLDGYANASERLSLSPVL